MSFTSAVNSGTLMVCRTMIRRILRQKNNDGDVGFIININAAIWSSLSGLMMASGVKVIRGDWGGSVFVKRARQVGIVVPASYKCCLQSLERTGVVRGVGGGAATAAGGAGGNGGSGTCSAWAANGA